MADTDLEILELEALAKAKAEAESTTSLDTRSPTKPFAEDYPFTSSMLRGIPATAGGTIGVGAGLGAASIPFGLAGGAGGYLLGKELENQIDYFRGAENHSPIKDATGSDLGEAALAPIMDFVGGTVVKGVGHGAKFLGGKLSKLGSNVGELLADKAVAGKIPYAKSGIEAAEAIDPSRNALSQALYPNVKLFEDKAQAGIQDVLNAIQDKKFLKGIKSVEQLEKLVDDEMGATALEAVKLSNTGEEIFKSVSKRGKIGKTIDTLVTDLASTGKSPTIDPGDFVSRVMKDVEEKVAQGFQRVGQTEKVNIREMAQERLESILTDPKAATLDIKAINNIKIAQDRLATKTFGKGTREISDEEQWIARTIADAARDMTGELAKKIDPVKAEKLALANNKYSLFSRIQQLSDKAAQRSIKETHPGTATLPASSSGFTGMIRDGVAALLNRQGSSADQLLRQSQLGQSFRTGEMQAPGLSLSDSGRIRDRLLELMVGGPAMVPEMAMRGASALSAPFGDLIASPMAAGGLPGQIIDGIQPQPQPQPPAPTLFPRTAKGINGGSIAALKAAMPDDVIGILEPQLDQAMKSGDEVMQSMIIGKILKDFPVLAQQFDPPGTIVASEFNGYVGDPMDKEFIKQKASIEARNQSASSVEIAEMISNLNANKRVTNWPKFLRKSPRDVLADIPLEEQFAQPDPTRASIESQISNFLPW